MQVLWDAENIFTRRELSGRRVSGLEMSYKGGGYLAQEEVEVVGDW